MAEIWKHSQSVPRWEVSSEGRVRNANAGAIMSIHWDDWMREWVVEDRTNQRYIPVIDLYREVFGMPDDPDWTPSLDKSRVNRRTSPVYYGKVYCFELDTWFRNMSVASRALGIDRSSLSRHLSGKQGYGSVGGYHFTKETP